MLNFVNNLEGRPKRCGAGESKGQTWGIIPPKLVPHIGAPSLLVLSSNFCCIQGPSFPLVEAYTSTTCHVTVIHIPKSGPPFHYPGPNWAQGTNLYSQCLPRDYDGGDEI